MRADDWKNLFQQNGWLQGNKIVAPSACELEIYFFSINSGSNYTVSTGGADAWGASILPIEFKEAFIIIRGTIGGSEFVKYLLWEDISNVRVMRRKEHVR